MRLGIKKLLKAKTLNVLMTNLQALASQGTHLGLYDEKGGLLFGPAALSQQELEAILASAEPDVDLARVRVLTVKDQLAGLLVAASPREATQLDAAANLLTHLIDQALENRALAQETLERYREINLLYRTQETLGAQLDLDQITDLVLKESIRVIQARSGVLLLLASDEQGLQVQARYGQAPIEIGDLHAHTDTIAGWVVQNRRAAIVNDITADPRCGPADAGAESLLCVPLSIGDECIGALVLYDKIQEIFTASDQKLLGALASQATVAIETARQVQAREDRLKAQIRELRIEIDEIRKQRQVDSITTTEYFARLQQNAQQMRQEFEEGL